MSDNRCDEHRPPKVSIRRGARAGCVPCLNQIRGAAKKLLDRNGGPIDAEETADGLAYVMVRASDFAWLAKVVDAEKEKA